MKCIDPATDDGFVGDIHRFVPVADHCLLKNTRSKCPSRAVIEQNDQDGGTGQKRHFSCVIVWSFGSAALAMRWSCRCVVWWIVQYFFNLRLKHPSMKKNIPSSLLMIHLSIQSIHMHPFIHNSSYYRYNRDSVHYHFRLQGEEDDLSVWPLILYLYCPFISASTHTLLSISNAPAIFFSVSDKCGMRRFHSGLHIHSISRTGLCVWWQLFQINNNIQRGQNFIWLGE